MFQSEVSVFHSNNLIMVQISSKKSYLRFGLSADEYSILEFGTTKHKNESNFGQLYQ